MALMCNIECRAVNGTLELQNKIFIQGKIKVQNVKNP